MTQTNKAGSNQAQPVTYIFREMDNGNIVPTRAVPGKAVQQLRAVPYELTFDPEKGAVLEPIPFVQPPEKLYGDVLKDVDHYFRTFERLKGNMGVMLVGQKGSGKTTTIMAMARTATMMDMPVIYCSQQYPAGMLEMVVRSLTQDVMFVFEEFDKQYSKQIENSGNNDTSAQDRLLSIFDGSVGGGKKLIVIAGNDSDRISQYLFDRPSRIRYTKYYSLLPLDVLVGYVRDNIKSKEEKTVMHFAKLSVLYDSLNFDMMAAMVDEMNHTPGLTVMGAMDLMFGGATKLRGTVLYHAKITYPDGRVENKTATERVTDVGTVVKIFFCSEDPEVKEVTTAVTLFEDEITKMSEDMRSYTYVKDDVTYELTMRQSTGRVGKLQEMGKKFDESVDSDPFDKAADEEGKIRMERQRAQQGDNSPVHVYPANYPMDAYPFGHDRKVMFNTKSGARR